MTRRCSADWVARSPAGHDSFVLCRVSYFSGAAPLVPGAPQNAAEEADRADPAVHLILRQQAVGDEPAAAEGGEMPDHPGEHVACKIRYEHSCFSIDLHVETRSHGDPSPAPAFAGAPSPTRGEGIIRRHCTGFADWPFSPCGRRWRAPDLIRGARRMRGMREAPQLRVQPCFDYKSELAVAALTSASARLTTNSTSVLPIVLPLACTASSTRSLALENFSRPESTSGACALTAAMAAPRNCPTAASASATSFGSMVFHSVAASPSSPESSRLPQSMMH